MYKNFSETSFNNFLSKACKELLATDVFVAGKAGNRQFDDIYKCLSHLYRWQ